MNRSINSLYEELRSIIDGGSESMNHADALQALRYMSEVFDEYLEDYRTGIDKAGSEIWMSLCCFGKPTMAYRPKYDTYQSERHRMRPT